MKEVWGIFTNDGDGNELLYHLGLFLSEEAASNYVVKEMPSSTDTWVDAIVVHV